MAITTLIQRLCARLREFRSADAANVTIIFALATVPVTGFVGAAIDYSRANSVKAAMQAATDSTALMLSRDAATLSSADLATKANGYFNALFTRPEVTGVTVTPTYSNSAGSQVIVAATGSIKTNFMALMGFSQLNISSSSTIKWGNTRLRVSLVLDNTGSMADAGKMTALITATKNLLTQLQTAAVNNGDVYVSIIPFSRDVNADPSNYKANWIDWTDWDAANGSCSKKDSNNRTVTSQSACEASKVGGKWTAANHNTWNGCVWDRGDSSGPNVGNYDTNVTPPNTAITATLLPADQYGSCTQAVKALSYDWSGMTSLVNGMRPNGNTNQGIGLQMGWMSLVGGGPFPAPPAMDPNYQYSQVVILLTDGLNTQNRWSSNQSAIDARQTMTCSNAKAAGITVYTIQVNTDGDPTSSLLQTCASDSSKFFLLTSSTQIVTTFQQIGTALSNLRIAY